MSSSRVISRKQWLQMVRQRGCQICRRPCEPHHPRDYRLGSGAGLKADDYYVIGLCREHHEDAHAHPKDFDNVGMAIRTMEDVRQAHGLEGAIMQMGSGLETIEEAVRFLKNFDEG